jgi:hypothetical protein
MRVHLCLLAASLIALCPTSPCVAQRQPVTTTLPDLPDEPLDGRVSWESPYFFVRRIPGTDYWAFVFRGMGGGGPFTFLLIESSRDPTVVVIESPKNDFRLQLFANRAIVTFPGTDKVPQRGKGECNGLWFVDGVALKPVTRKWHPSGSKALAGRVCIPRSLGSVELQQQLEDAGAIKTVLIGDNSADATELPIADLPEGEREAAVGDLAVANAPRWMLKVRGKPSKEGGTARLYLEDPLFSKELIGLLPPEWHKWKQAAEENSVYGLAARRVEETVSRSLFALDIATTAVRKHAMLKKPLGELDVETFAQLSETVLTELDDRLTKTALGMIGVGGENPTLAALDQAVKNGDKHEIVLAWADFTKVERAAFVAVSTQTIFGRVRCPQSRLTHIDLLSKACEVAIEAGPAVIEALATKQKEADDDLLRQQLQAMPGNK